jgi:hypothetical protein
LKKGSLAMANLTLLQHKNSDVEHANSSKNRSTRFIHFRAAK